MKSANLLLDAFLVVALAACGSSFQPTISDRATPPPTAPETAEAPAVITQPVSDDTPAVAAVTPLVANPTCTRTHGHTVYYAGSHIDLSFDCGAAVASASGTPPYLTLTINGTTVTAAGTAPDAAATDAWTLVVNGAAAAATSTRTIASTPTVALATPAPDVASHYGNAVAVTFSDIALDPLWDGDPADVSVAFIPATPAGDDTPASFDQALFAAADADTAGLRFASACAGADATGSYICPAATTSVDAHTVAGGAELLWKWGPFDQGAYAIGIRPFLTIEGATLRAAPLAIAVTIPASAAATLATTNSVHASGALDDRAFAYGLSLNRFASTPAAPVFAFAYASAAASGAGNKRAWLTRARIDRAASPLAPAALAQSAALDLTGAHTAQLQSLHALADGSYASLAVIDGELTFNRVADSATAPALAPGMPIAVSAGFAGNYDFKSIAASEPFTDTDGVTRIGVAYATRDMFGNDVLGLGKINPAGTALTGGAPSLSDDADFRTTDVDFNVSSLLEHDNLNVAAGSRLGAKALFLAFRLGNDAQVGYVLTNKDSGTGLAVYAFQSLTGDLSPQAFNGAGAGSAQSLALALGARAGTDVLGVVWREQEANNGGAPRCLFRRIDAATLAPASRSLPVVLSTGPCREPRIAFDAASGRFVATYAEQVAGAWRLASRQISLDAGGNDTSSTPLVLASLAAAPVVRLEAAYYPEGEFVGVFYRIQGDDSARFTGYHVSP